MRSPRGAASPSYKTGRTYTGKYITVVQHGHPRAVRGRVLEHVLVVERALGHYLDGKHPIHHVDDNGTNNEPSNLVVCEDAAYHRLLHQRQRALDACGDPSAHPCRFCHSYDRQEDIRRAWGPKASHHHRAGANQYNARRGYKRASRARKGAAILTAHKSGQPIPEGVTIERTTRLSIR